MHVCGTYVRTYVCIHARVYTDLDLKGSGLQDEASLQTVSYSIVTMAPYIYRYIYIYRSVIVRPLDHRKPTFGPQ